MSRTKRNLPPKRGFYFRKPRTTQEIRENEGFLVDVNMDKELPSISGLNRMRRYIPTHWDDIVLSAYFESDYKMKR